MPHPTQVADHLVQLPPGLLGRRVYTYSGLRNVSRPWTPLLSELWVEVSDLAACPFNSVLANLYRTGRDRMGWHADDERELGS